MSRWLFLAGAILFEVTASLSLKGALTHPALYLVVAIGYVASFTCLGASLRAGMALGVAYGIWGATGVALTAALSTVFFGEPFTPLMGMGIALIIGGVLLVELGSQAAHRRGAAASVARAAPSPTTAAGSDPVEGGRE
ncbi:multidrug efflux SMR transporter [Leifsonia sp. ZF2019]|uniref:DMT family transporter n=1 Tax=Leifsonia sp. ZF2019 TaxID=2781978 RepID=UPI001CBCE483|nr:multidrug efflux SMR transporter [Leifsonia sp. ZF2019]UAJ78820.1 multidrug efflux SMR transporter [Leifsonia sp. ZF2019]